MRLWPFGRRQKSTVRTTPLLYRETLLTGDIVVTTFDPQAPRVVPFPQDTFQLPKAKHHGLRALCGLLADRHSSCHFDHPFCGPPPDSAGDNLQAIVQATSQEDENSGEPVMALYLTQAEQAEEYLTSTEPVDPLEFVAKLRPYTRFPGNKLVVNLLDNGCYTAEYGRIENPTELDYSTGRLDRSVQTQRLYLDPEPAHVRWWYQEDSKAEDQVVVPEFHCLMLRNEWWIVDVDRQRGIYGQVAYVDFADNSAHLRRAGSALA